MRAARMVSAAVAARTRSCFLQAWVISHSLSLAFVSFLLFVGIFCSLSLSFSLGGICWEQLRQGVSVQV